MADRLLFVQFIHPGGEHVPDKHNMRSWNMGPHRRKFMLSEGAYLSDAGDLTKGQIEFWGEWEPESEVVRSITENLPEGPHFLYRPYQAHREDYSGLQNTDPFVFGDRFCYTCCQQRTVRGPTLLRWLDRGSVILFGSCRADRFILDTVFVVESWTDHSAQNFEEVVAPQISPAYISATFAPWYGQSLSNGLAVGSALGEGSYRLYFGATHSSPVNEMFSFFPCLESGATSFGFERPSISMPQITDGLRQGKKSSAVSDFSEMNGLWSNVREQVQSAGLRIGVSADMPLIQDSRVANATTADWRRQ